ncbi:MAG TPA: glycosyl hydrolase [Armatimonadota bacterium]
MKRLLALALLCAVSAVSAAPASAPPAIQPSPFGIDGLKPRFGKDLPNLWTVEDELANYMTDAGLRWDRAIIQWDDVQPDVSKPFDWTFTDRMAKVYGQRPISAYCLLMGRPSSWKANPHTPEERAQFADFVYETVKRYKGTFRVWEIWNEPNIPAFWNPPSAEDYAALLKASYAAAKRADPTCTVLSGGTSGVDLGWIRRVLFEQGGWDACDAVAIHPYSMGGGPDSQGLSQLLRMTRAAAAKGGVSKPIWITEVGWTTDTTPQSELRQAEYIDQEYCIALANGVVKTFWFTMGDWSERWGIIAGKDNTPDWGFTSTKRPKPAYYALKHLTEALTPSGKRPTFLGYLPNAKGATAMAFLADGDPKQPVAVLWSPFGEKRVLAMPQATGLHALDAHGKTVTSLDGNVMVTEVPIIVTGFQPGALKSASKAADPSVRKPSVNLLRNGDMERPDDGGDVAFWNHGAFPNGGKDGKTEWLTGGRGLGRALSVSAAKDAAWSGVPVPVQPGKAYTLKVWAKPTAAAGENKAIIAWYRGDMWGWLSQAESEPVEGTGDWREITVTAKPPEDAVFARIVFTSKDNPGAILWDDAALTEG